MTQHPPSRLRGSETLWLDAASDLLCEAGIDAVKIMPLAKRVGLSRPSFYWHFKDREALLDAMVQRWEAKNTDGLITRIDAYAENICEAIFNLFDCWLNDNLFDSRLDLAIRNWARTDTSLQQRLDQADAQRRIAIEGIFTHFGYSETEAEVRTRALLFAQTGHSSMEFQESRFKRLARIPDYVEVFTGQRPSEGDVGRFMSRHLAE
ncbi:TetR/AcrR family transcriptional regulator [Phaeobacter gallaeciensis]|uniref:TetR/AcrR family transcriptional regulator n=2 Tax=Roseobacteraceae TaxID=2854170 RepID=A0A366XCL3_9RHOB|nr:MULTISPECIES: TetR/AcrR family transcriptional regulator [Roseobacteraceae]MBT3142610.1 TetR/AcrR family transcriptional regulator [Falsiruegeria litorea]MBT8171016.1 TetR/AcrR family transcriptional regulator [Falsiruegeria litorea]RBW61083.1 TetR/AcrR family transcriptional regulator [Phaeobacter gallaeciensis]